MNTLLLRKEPRSRRLGAAVAVLLVVGIGVGATFGLSRLEMGTGGSHGRLTVENPSPFILNIEVTGRERGGWLNLGTVRREGRLEVDEVRDQGDEWVFRFSHAGVDAGELVLTRDLLAKDDWTVTVPKDVPERLRAQGFTESAR